MASTTNQIGIYAPYNWTEATNMALTLAEMFGRFGYQVSYYPAGPVTVDKVLSVHHRWDHQILDTMQMSFAEWAKGMRVIVWFGIYPEQRAEVTRQDTAHYLVVLPCDISRKLVSQIPMFNAAVAPSRHAAALLRKLGCSRKTVTIPWDSALPLGERLNAPINRRERRLLVFTDEVSARKIGVSIAETLKLLLQQFPSLKATVAHAAGWTKPAFKTLTMLEKEYSNRVMLVARPCFVERTEAAMVHDWIWLPLVQDNAAAFALEFLCRGRPVIAFDSLTTAEVVQQDYNGAVMRCSPQRLIGLGIDEMQPTAKEMHDVLRRTVFDTETFFRCYTHHWTELETRKREFQSAWQDMLSLEAATRDELYLSLPV